MLPVAQWPIRVRRTLEPHGEAAPAFTIFCPARALSLDAEECLACPHGDGATFDDTGHATHVRCARHPQAGDATGVEVRERPQTAAGATPLSQVMTPAVWCIGPGLDTARAGAFLYERNIGCTPVVDRDGYPIGILSRADLARNPDAATVAEAMSPLAFTLAERAPLAHAAALMAIEGVHHLPVVGSDGRVVGMVSTLDVTAWVARQEGYVV